MSEFKLRRLGMLMEPEPGKPLEVEGVLNPAAVRGSDGALYHLSLIHISVRVIPHHPNASVPLEVEQILWQR